MNDEIQKCFRELDLEPGASQEDVTEAYRTMLKVWHPDRLPDDPKLQKKANDKTRQIVKAYQRIKEFFDDRAKAARQAAEAAAREQEEIRKRADAKRREEEQARRQAEARKHPDVVGTRPASPAGAFHGRADAQKQEEEANKVREAEWRQGFYSAQQGQARSSNSDELAEQHRLWKEAVARKKSGHLGGPPGTELRATCNEEGGTKPEEIVRLWHVLVGIAALICVSGIFLLMEGRGALGGYLLLVAFATGAVSFAFRGESEIKTACYFCNGPIEFRQGRFGAQAACPHCGAYVELRRGMCAKATIAKAQPAATPRTSEELGRKFFIFKNGQQQGPFSLEEIKSRLATGALSATDFVWWEGQVEWIPLERAGLPLGTKSAIPKFGNAAGKPVEAPMPPSAGRRRGILRQYPKCWLGMLLTGVAIQAFFPSSSAHGAFLWTYLPHVIGAVLGMFLAAFILAGLPALTYRFIGKRLTPAAYMATFTVAFCIVVACKLMVVQFAGSTETTAAQPTAASQAKSESKPNPAPDKPDILVDVKGFGTVSFPASMTQEEIVAALRKNFPPPTNPPSARGR